MVGRRGQDVRGGKGEGVGVLEPHKSHKPYSSSGCRVRGCPLTRQRRGGAGGLRMHRLPIIAGYKFAVWAPMFEHHLARRIAAPLPTLRDQYCPVLNGRATNPRGKPLAQHPVRAARYTTYCPIKTFLVNIMPQATSPSKVTGWRSFQRIKKPGPEEVGRG